MPLHRESVYISESDHFILMNRTTIAFFDVDGTLTTRTSLFGFLAFFLEAMGEPPSTYRDERRRIADMTRRGVPRECTNRAYFENLTNVDAGDVGQIASAWFEDELCRGDFFYPPAVRLLEEHLDAGHVIAAVSGSFPAILAPIVASLRIGETWCSSPEIRSGRYTGRLSAPPMIGARKAEAVRESAASHQVDAADCISYGDHVSDLPMLRATGSAGVVGPDRTLHEIAAENGWRIVGDC